jgi:hypothetical protein
MCKRSGSDGAVIKIINTNVYLGLLIICDRGRSEVLFWQYCKLALGRWKIIINNQTRQV